MANCVPSLTLLVAKCCGTRPAGSLFRMCSGETRTITRSCGVQQQDPIWRALFCPAVRPGLKRFREEFEGEEVEPFAYMDYISPDFMVVTANAIRTVSFLRHERL